MGIPNFFGPSYFEAALITRLFVYDHILGSKKNRLLAILYSSGFWKWISAPAVTIKHQAKPNQAIASFPFDMTKFRFKSNAIVCIRMAKSMQKRQRSVTMMAYFSQLQHHIHKDVQ